MTNSETNDAVQSPLTGSRNVSYLFDVKDYSVSGQQFSIYQDETVPFRFTWPVPNESEITRFYDSETYISHSNTSEGITAKLYQLARTFTIGYKKRLLFKMNSGKSGHLLDIGCGTGEFATAMKNSGWDAFGVEPGRSALDFAVGEHGLDVYKNIFDVPESDKFDAITAWHVLEHIHELDKTLERCHELLNDDGSFIIALPNFLSTDSTFYKDVWAGYDVPRHLYHFSPDSVKMLAENHNFTVTKVKRMWLDSFYISLLSESYMRTGYAGFLGAFSIGLWSNFLALFNPGKCSSLMYVLRKR